ncbi:hypothetical protein C8Q80DRAFT_468038 [Daedaleopsis nitida]|nr:hypothetical protein C8Q80DRAFT_468038 [Daedaleopsis nitida]
MVTSSSKPTLSVLENIDEDVFWLIAHQLTRVKSSLVDLSSTSRRMRRMAMPLLFSRCVTWFTGRSELPPVAIRPLVRHLKYKGRIDADRCEETFGKELPCLPALCSIAFDGRGVGVPWCALKRCLSLPLLTALTFEEGTSFRRIDPYPAEELADISINLKSLSHNASPWLLFTPIPTNTVPTTGVIPQPEEQFQEHFVLESRCLSAIVSKLPLTVEYLKLSVETAPLAQMCTTPWPCLRELHLYGYVIERSELPFLRDLLCLAPRLHTLSVELCHKKLAKNDRSSVLGRPPYTLDRTLAIKALKLAYPDPQDAILIAASGPHLTSLSLNDHPRFYLHRLCTALRSRWSAPLLSSADCLGILQRMDIPNLQTFELVYQTEGDDDDELLQYVATAYASLSHLEIHRYRRDWAQSIPYLHIARLLEAAKSLRTVHLNLDFHEDHGPYSMDSEARSRWARIRNTRGQELANVLQSCPILEYVALFYNAYESCLWVEYHPSRCAEPHMRFAEDDSPPLPLYMRH